jgi:NitT/TauT family transport system substrate-binding protein
MDPKVAVAAVTAMVKVGYWSAGALDAKLLDNMADALRLTGEVQGAVDWQKAIDVSYLPADLKAKSRLTPQ